MPSPSSPSTFQRPDLGAAFEEFPLLASMQGFIGLRALPLFSVGLQTASFSVIPIEALLADRDTARASGSGYSRQDWEFTQDSYATKEFGAEDVIDDRERGIYAYSIDIERVAAERAMAAVLRAQEKRIADLIFSTTTFTGALTTAVGTEWSKAASATPVDDVLTAHSAFKANCGMLPNALIFSDKVLRNLQKCEQVIDRIKYAGIDDPKAVTLNALATLFQVEQILVGGSVRNSALQGQSATIADIWDDEYAMLCRIPMSGDLREAGLGRTFHWTGDGSSQGGTVEMYREEKVRGDVVRVRLDMHEKIIYSQCGYLMSNITE